MTLKGYSAISVFLGKLDIHVFSQCNFFLSVHLAGYSYDPWFYCLPSGKFTTGFHPEKFLKILHFRQRVEQYPPGYWDRLWFCFENSTLFKTLNEVVICRNNFCGNVIFIKKHNTSTISMLIWTKWCSKSIQEKVTIRKIIV